MAISQKGKRTIRVDEKTYFWWVYDEVDQTSFDGVQIKLVAKDQSHYLHYGLQQEDGDRFVLVCLRNNSAGIALDCPKFENEAGIMTPAGIRKLISWCKTQPDAATSWKIVENHQLK